MHEKKVLELRILSCSQTISQVKKLLEKNSIRSDLREHFETLQKTLDNLDINNLDKMDVENIEEAINRALKAISQFLPEDVFKGCCSKTRH